MTISPDRNLVWHPGQIGAEKRRHLLGQRPVTLWLTGLSGAGKSTLAYALEAALIGQGHACLVLDGDNVRHGLNRDLGFSDADRRENIRRVAEVARLLNDAGLIAISAFISPFRSDRAMAKEIIGADCFREIYVSTPLSVCERRDPKNFYAKAKRGEIAQFTGISAPYEIPECPDLDLDTCQLSVDQCLEKIFACLRPFIADTDLPPLTEPA